MNLYIEFLMKIDLLIHNYFNYYININNIINDNYLIIILYIYYYYLIYVFIM